MEKKINIAELLKDSPRGMELDCTMFEDVKFISVEDGNKPICIRTGDIYRYLTKFGTWTFDKNAKCVIFPKGKTTWKGFAPPCKFKDGDVVINASNEESNAFIYRGKDNYHYKMYVGLTTGCAPKLVEGSDAWVRIISRLRFATEKEKEKLFKAIKDNGYEWNAETKTLKKLVPNKFDITTLKPFDKVLVRDNNEQKWTVDLFSFYDKDLIYTYACVGHYVNQCIPYEGNQHLLGTTDDCDEFYKV